MLKIWVKFCGGCDPIYDRMEFFQSVKRSLFNRVEWVSDAPDVVLIINGCQRACPEKGIKKREGVRVISVTNENYKSIDIAELLIGSKGGKND